MIHTKEDLREYICQDAKACRRTTVKAKWFGDETWKFQLTMRKLEYYQNGFPMAGGLRKLLWIPQYIFYRYRFAKKSVKLGYTIPVNVCDKGLSIAHIGTIVIGNEAHIGSNCRIQEGVTIGATNGSSKSAVIGENVFIGTGAKIIGEITIADDVAIGANAVVVKSITEKGTTWAGAPAHKISDNSSRSNLSPMLFS